MRLSARWRDKVGTGGLVGALGHAIVTGRLGHLEARAKDAEEAVPSPTRPQPDRTRLKA